MILAIELLQLRQGLGHTGALMVALVGNVAVMEPKRQLIDEENAYTTLSKRIQAAESTEELFDCTEKVSGFIS